MVDSIDEVTAKYGDKDFGSLSAMQQNEYLSALAKRAGMDGATSVLSKLGLKDENAAADLKDIRDLLRAFRAVRNRTWLTLLGYSGKVIAFIILLIIAQVVVKSDVGKSLVHVLE